jgi:hypothetical protein
MTTSARISRLPQAFRAALLLFAISAAALANEAPRLVAGAKTPLCYCHCQHENGKECTKMCELPQYKNRWWAASCHKKSAASKEFQTPARNAGSRKTNRTEQAAL